MHRSIIMASTAAAAQATNLFVSSYAGTLSSLSLDNDQLTVLSSTTGCSPSPSWLTLNKQTSQLYCIDENLSGDDGSINTFSINGDYSLTQTGRQSTSPGPVSAVLYGNGGDDDAALAVAHYGPGGAVSAFTTNATGVDQLIVQQNEGDDSHVHEVIKGPTGQYILAPDLGADQVRVFEHVDTLDLTEVPELALHLDAGTGPRHGGFLTYGSDQYFYLVAELSNKLLGYKVTYPDSGIAFEQVVATNTFGGGAIPDGAAAGELAISPDQRFVSVSNRGDKSVDGNDSIATYKVTDGGALEFVELASVGGSFPRQFSFNADGSLVAVGLQKSAKVNILTRDTDSGKITGTKASVDIDGEITCVIWDE